MQSYSKREVGGTLCSTLCNGPETFRGLQVRDQRDLCFVMLSCSFRYPCLPFGVDEWPSVDLYRHASTPLDVSLSVNMYLDHNPCQSICSHWVEQTCSTWGLAPFYRFSLPKSAACLGLDPDIIGNVMHNVHVPTTQSTACAQKLNNNIF